MKKRGFTLIELLAVIVILAIIALIAVPIVLGVIDKAKRGAFEDSVKVSSRQIELYLFKNNLSKIPSDGVNVKDLDIKSDFTSGKFIEENGVVTAYFIKNKDYCAYGPVDNLLIKKDCNDLDISYPTIDDSKLATTRTSNSITVILSEGFAIDEESGIVKYEINIYDGSTKVDSETLNDIGNVTFEKLTNGKEYKIEVIVTNGNDMTSSATRNVETVTVDKPTYSVSPSSDEKEWATSRTVTINYPEGYTNEYSIDGGETWNPYTEPIVFLQPGTVLARVFDGTNYITGNSQTIKNIDLNAPTLNVTTTLYSKRIDIEAICEDLESEISKIEYSVDNGETWKTDGIKTTYSFTDLEKGQYNVKARCTNGAGIPTTSESISVSTWEKYPTVTLTTEADTVLGQTVIATLIKDENGETPNENYIVTDVMKNTTVLTLEKIGTYLIEASSSDGLANYSNEITVDYDNEYEIEKYIVRMYLFDNGDITVNSGGWGVMWEASGGTPGAATSGGTVSSTLYLTAGSSYKKDMYAKNNIDLTGWNKLVAECTYHNNIGSGWSAIHLYTPGGYYSKDLSMVITTGVGLDVGTNTLDISEINQSARIAFLAARTEWRVSQVYLEK